MALLDGSDETVTGGAARRRVPTPIGTQRALQLVLGVFWIVDAALQYQPFMSAISSCRRTSRPTHQANPSRSAGSLPTPVTSSRPTWLCGNALFATVQLAIGIGLLFPRTVRPTLLTSFFWAVGVWVFGEGGGVSCWVQPAR